MKYILAIKLFTEVLISLDVNVGKYSLETKFYSPYEMCCYVGIIEFILYSSLFSLSNIFKIINKFKVDFKQFEKIDIFVYIIIFIMKFYL